MPPLHALSLELRDDVGSKPSVLLQKGLLSANSGLKKMIQKKKEVKEETKTLTEAETQKLLVAQKDFEEAVLTHALSDAFLCIPAPITKGVFGVVYLVAVNRLMAGFGEMDEWFVDDFEWKAVKTIEYFSIKEQLEAEVAAGHYKPGEVKASADAASIGAPASKSPFDDFSKFRKAKGVPFPDEGAKDVMKKLAEHFKETSLGFMAVYNGNWKSLEDFCETLLPVILRGVRDIYVLLGQPSKGAIEGLDAALEKAKGEPIMNSVADLIKVFLNKGPLGVYNRAFETKDLGDGTGWTEFFDDYPNRVKRVANRATKNVNYKALMGATAGEAAKKATINNWKADRIKMTSRFGLAGRLLFMLSYIIDCIAARFITYQTKSVQVWVKANGPKTLNAASKKIADESYKKNIISTTSICKDIRDCLTNDAKKWHKSQRAALKLTRGKAPFLNDGSWLGWSVKLLYNNAKRGFRFYNVIWSGNLPVLELAESLASQLRIHMWRKSVKKAMDGMLEANENMRTVYSTLLCMQALPEPTDGQIRCINGGSGGASLPLRFEARDDEDDESDEDDEYDGGDLWGGGAGPSPEPGAAGRGGATNSNCEESAIDPDDIDWDSQSDGEDAQMGDGEDGQMSDDGAGVGF